MDKAERFWDKVAVNYDKSESRFEPLHVKTIENTKRHLTADDVVLDYGCATGKKTFELARRVKRIHGIDISSKMIDGARRHAVERGVDNVEFTHALIFDERFKAGSFDIVLGFNIVHALEDQREVMRRISELIRPGGLFISVTPCLRERMAFTNRSQMALYILFMKLGWIPDMLTRFRFPELDEAITSGDLEITEAENMFHRMSSRFIVARKKNGTQMEGET